MQRRHLTGGPPIRMVSARRCTLTCKIRSPEPAKTSAAAELRAPTSRMISNAITSGDMALMKAQAKQVALESGSDATTVPPRRRRHAAAHSSGAFIWLQAHCRHPEHCWDPAFRREVRESAKFVHPLGVHAGWRL